MQASMLMDRPSELTFTAISSFERGAVAESRITSNWLVGLDCSYSTAESCDGQCRTGNKALTSSRCGLCLAPSTTAQYRSLAQVLALALLVQQAGC